MASSTLFQPLYSTFQQYDSVVLTNPITALTSSGALVIQNNADATSFDGLTGSIRTLGGLSVAKSAYMNRTLNVNGLATLSGGLTVPTGNINSNSLNTVTASITTLTANALNVANTINLSNTQDLTSFVTQGGATIAKTLSANAISCAAALTTSSFTSGTANVSGLTNLSNTTISGVLTSSNTTDANASTSTTSSINTAGGLSVAKSIFTKDLNVSNQLNVLSSSFTNAINANGGILTTNATISNTFIANGSITGNGKVTFTDATDSTSPTSTATVTIPNGGLAVANTVSSKNILVSNNLSTSTLNVSGLLSSNGTLQSNTILNSGTITSPSLQVSGTSDASTSASTTAALSVPSGGIACNNTIFGNKVMATLSMTAPAATFSNVVTTANLNSTTINNTGLLNVTSTSNASTSTSSSASINTLGGISCAKDFFASTVNSTSTTATSTIAGPFTLTGNINSSALWTHSAALKLSNTTDAINTTSTTAALQVLGGIACASTIQSGSLGIGNNILQTSAQTTSASSQTGTATAANVFRIRSNDATNTTIGMSLGNTGVGASSYYESHLSLFNLGSLNSSTNYERMLLGINSSGGYINYLYGGTGVNRPLNVMQGAVFSTGGNMSLASNLQILNTLDATSTTMTTAPLYVAGGVSINGSLFANTVNVSNITALSSASSAVSTMQGGSSLNTNALRLRTNDTTNTSTSMVLSNTAMGNNYYDSHMALYNLGSSSTSTNYERVLLGVNASGAYINYMYSGTGTTRPLNILNGSVFRDGGALNLANNLNVTGTQDVVTATPPNTSMFTAGGLYVTKQTNLQGLLTAAGGFLNPITYYLHAYTTSSQTISTRTTTALSCSLAAITFTPTMSAVLTSSTSNPNTFTAPVGGVWSFQASLKVTPGTAGTLEFYAQANSNNTYFTGNTTRYIHEQKVVTTAQTKISITNKIPMNQGDTIQFFFYFTPSSLSGASVTVNASTDNILSFSLDQRAS